MTTISLAIFANDTKNKNLQEVKERLNECLTNVFYFDNYNYFKLLTSVRALKKQFTLKTNETNETKLRLIKYDISEIIAFNEAYELNANNLFDCDGYSLSNRIKQTLINVEILKLIKTLFKFNIVSIEENEENETNETILNYIDNMIKYYYIFINNDNYEIYKPSFIKIYNSILINVDKLESFHEFKINKQFEHLLKLKEMVAILFNFLIEFPEMFNISKTLFKDYSPIFEENEEEEPLSESQRLGLILIDINEVNNEKCYYCKLFNKLNKYLMSYSSTEIINNYEKILKTINQLINLFDDYNLIKLDDLLFSAPLNFIEIDIKFNEINKKEIGIMLNDVKKRLLKMLFRLITLYENKSKLNQSQKLQLNEIFNKMINNYYDSTKLNYNERITLTNFDFAKFANMFNAITKKIKLNNLKSNIIHRESIINHIFRFNKTLFNTNNETERRFSRLITLTN